MFVLFLFYFNYHIDVLNISSVPKDRRPTRLDSSMFAETLTLAWVFTAKTQTRVGYKHLMPVIIVFESRWGKHMIAG